MANENNLNNLRHSAAHLLAAAVKDLWPGTHNAIGPAIENGFYQDFDFGEVKISEADFAKIEKRMREILPSWNEFTFNEVTLEEAQQLFKDNPYKLELAAEFAGDGKKLQTNDPGDFLDLCKMGHVEHPSEELKNFKLLSVAGAYWRGSEKNKMLTRIYGTVFETKEELDNYVQLHEEAKKRDHRKLGKELDLFVFSDLVGKGLPLFTPKGTLLRNLLNDFSQQLRLNQGFEKVWIPHITKNDLYKMSGHWDKFGNELFLVKSQETTDELIMKPMNCPHHQQIYASRPRSYKDLPIKYLETTTIYRDEKAGELLGLSRVRAVTQDDSHIFCTPEQIEVVYQMLIDITKTFYETIGMKFKARLSFSDPQTPEKYLGEPDLWKKAETIILDIAKSNKLDYFVAVGEAAFYGPKIDFMVTDALGRQWQLATPQLDFVQPKRFGLVYTDNEGLEQTPVMIHFALLGSLERFLSVYIEHTAGAFPVWLSPIQAAILPVSDKFVEYGQKVATVLKEHGIRVLVDTDNKTLGAKIRETTLQKIPFMCIMGEKEIEEGRRREEDGGGKRRRGEERDEDKNITVSVRTREGKDLGSMLVIEFAQLVSNNIENKQ